MKDCNELRSQLSEVFAALRNGEVNTEQASELANIAGKIINSAKVQVAYYELLKSAPRIDFLKDDAGKALE